MKTVSELIEEAHKIVIKIGSNSISDESGRVNPDAMEHIVKQIVALIKKGKRLVIVSSGAGSCGVGAINKWQKKRDINYKQALCAIGQVELMNTYKTLFAEHGLHVAQLLLTKEDFHEHNREINIRNALFTLIDEGIIPIINENDSVSVEEIRIGDNDTLSALTVNLWASDLLILMSDIDGIYDKSPCKYSDANMIDYVDDIDLLEKTIQTDGLSNFGTGGIVTKIHAARMANEYGIPVILTNSKRKNILQQLESGQAKATVFFDQGEHM